MIKFKTIIEWINTGKKMNAQDLVSYFQDAKNQWQDVIGPGKHKIKLTQDFGKHKAGDELIINLFGESSKEIDVQTKKGKVKTIPKTAFTLVESYQINETIRHIGKNKWRLASRHRGKNGKKKNLGTYSSKAGAERREKQVQYFKHKG
jgi:hypothetical protein